MVMQQHSQYAACSSTHSMHACGAAGVRAALRDPCSSTSSSRCVGMWVATRGCKEGTGEQAMAVMHVAPWDCVYRIRDLCCAVGFPHLSQHMAT
jgi:hypothetical protein